MRAGCVTGRLLPSRLHHKAMLVSNTAPVSTFNPASSTVCVCLMYSKSSVPAVELALVIHAMQSTDMFNLNAGL